jgi:hypothetical protein
MAELLEDPAEVIDQSLQGWFSAVNSRKDSQVPGHSQVVPTETKRLTHPPFEPVACGRRPGCFRNENPILELLGWLPDKSKKIGRKPLPLVEKRIDLDPAFQARRAWKLTFSDQSLPPTVCGPWLDDGPAPCGRSESPSERGSRDRSVFCGSMVEMFFS